MALFNHGMHNEIYFTEPQWILILMASTNDRWFFPASLTAPPLHAAFANDQPESGYASCHRGVLYSFYTRFDSKLYLFVLFSDHPVI